MSDDSGMTPCYVAITTCGCVVGATVDDGTRPESVAECIADWVKRGAIVERKTVQWARDNLKFCSHKKAKSP